MKHKRTYRRLSHPTNRRWYQIDVFTGWLPRFARWRAWKVLEWRVLFQLVGVALGRRYDALDFPPDVRSTIPAVVRGAHELRMALWRLRAALRMLPLGVLFFAVLALLYVVVTMAQLSAR